MDLFSINNQLIRIIINVSADKLKQRLKIARSSISSNICSEPTIFVSSYAILHGGRCLARELLRCSNFNQRVQVNRARCLAATCSIEQVALIADPLLMARRSNSGKNG